MEKKAEMFAYRNLRLCTKDCLCLYVCPSGATDTENSIIDREKCIGCGKCAAACPSGAIHMVPYDYPPQQPKTKKPPGAEFMTVMRSTLSGMMVMPIQVPLPMISRMEDMSSMVRM